MNYNRVMIDEERELNISGNHVQHHIKNMYFPSFFLDEPKMNGFKKKNDPSNFRSPSAFKETGEAGTSSCHHENVRGTCYRYRADEQLFIAHFTITSYYLLVLFLFT